MIENLASCDRPSSWKQRGTTGEGDAAGNRQPHMSRILATTAWAAAVLAIVRLAATFIADLTFPSPLELLPAIALVLGAGILVHPWLAKRLRAPRPQPLVRHDLWRGVAMGGGPAMALIALLWVTGTVRLAPGGPDAKTPLIVLLAALLGWCTELFIRGTAFALVEQRAGGQVAIWVSVLFVAAVDIVLGWPPLAILTVAGLGVMWGRQRLADRAPGGAAVAHALWNAVVAAALGMGLGTGTTALLPGPTWWAGGAGDGQSGLAAVLVALVCAVGIPNGRPKAE